MILAFTVAVILFAFLLFTKKKLLRKHWYVLFLFGFVFVFLVSFVSVRSTWNPYTSVSIWTSNWRPNEGNYLGASLLSYPLHMSVNVGQQTLPENEEGNVVGNVSFNVFIANENVLKTNGVLSYDLITALKGAPAPVSYQLDFPFFSDGISFFGFLLFLFTLADMVGFALGLSLAYVVSKALATRKHVAANNRTLDIH